MPKTLAVPYDGKLRSSAVPEQVRHWPSIRRVCSLGGTSKSLAFVVLETLKSWGGVTHEEVPSLCPESPTSKTWGTPAWESS